MTVKELKEIIKDLPDEMKVGGTGYLGEFLDCYTVMEDTAYFEAGHSEKILSITIEYSGDEPV